MSFFSFRPEAYRRVNYEVWKVKLVGDSIVRAFIGADFIDVSYSNADLSKVYISFNGGEFVPISSALPAHTAFGLIHIVWDSSEDGKEIVFIVGHDYFRSAKQSVSILADNSGIKADLDLLVKALASINADKILTTPDNPPNLDVALSETKIARPSALKSAKVSIDNSTGTASIVQQLFSTATPSKHASIYRDPNDTGTIYIGDSTTQAFPLNPGAVIETDVDDLSVIYVQVPAGVTANIYVLWEV